MTRDEVIADAQRKVDALLTELRADPAKREAFGRQLWPGDYPTRWQRLRTHLRTAWSRIVDGSWGT